ncbi:DinB family protein [Niabella yanshanensis]|uniref:DinB family protein n=1 Tax=Niabella yanshanensis TaxID=577386 RepID=A0ABZ0W894_9BACT|nr:DinB family protein [Niabella yanshanensis]WQD39503.1 DinB family protein [Niabella yanshanensis]
MRPQKADYPVFYDTYICLTTGADVQSVLSQSLNNLDSFLHSIPENRSNFAYAEGKWTVKEVVQHCIDTERIFAYRALSHARGEQQSLPGFEQNDYAATADVAQRSLTSLIEEFILVRRTTVLLFEGLLQADLERIGIINGQPIKTFCWGYIIEGHWLHHQRILKEKYSL